MMEVEMTARTCGEEDWRDWNKKLGEKGGEKGEAEQCRGSRYTGK